MSGKMLCKGYCPKNAADASERDCVFPDCVDTKDCSTCKREGMKPSHFGSARCESGSIASGGNRAHCTCDTCF